MPELPTGTVTFLFTDIEGSTQLLQRLREHYPTLLTDYRHLLRTAFQTFGGHEVDTQGDSFFVAFPRARDALQAAVLIQQRSARHAWPEGVVLQTRIGLHTGEPHLTAEGYVGLDVHRAARLCAAGHGGQVLLSQTTRDLVAQDLPPGVGLRDLGQHRLKDLQYPEHIFQLVIAELPADFPPLKTLDNRPNNLPLQPTPFIGREREVGEVLSLLRRDDVRLVTLIGPGGVGKTRLSLQAAAELLDEFVDGVWVVDLAPIRDPALVASAIAQKLGVTEVGGQSLLESLTEYLREKQILLVLDNFEQVVAAALLLADLLNATAQLKLLITSRVVLHLYSEQQYPVFPLAVPTPLRSGQPFPPVEQLTQYAAVEVFIQRAQRVKPDFQVTNENAPAVAEICVRLDGLPLAIELAAARIKIFTPQALLARLQGVPHPEGARPGIRRLDVLTGGARDLHARQRALRSTLDWSYQLLEADEQRLFARLGVFAGGCTLEAVEVICNAQGNLQVDVLDGLASLVDKSLLRQMEASNGYPDGEPRFIMLETIREYALEQLEASGEADCIRRNHATFFLALAEQAEPELWGPQQAAWLRRLEAEHDNLLAALQWSRAADTEIGLRLATELWRFWGLRGRFSEGRHWLEKIVDPTSGAAKLARARALSSAGKLAGWQGDAVRASALLEEALALYRELGDEEGLAWSLLYLGRTARDRGDYRRAATLEQESLALFQTAGSKRGITLVLLSLGDVALDQGDVMQAEARFQQALALSQELGDLGSGALALSNLGRVAYHQGDNVQAAARYQESLALYRELGSIWGGAEVLIDLGRMALKENDDVQATAYYRESLTLIRELGAKHVIAMCLEGLAGVAGAHGQHPEGARRAARLFGAAEVLRESIAAPLRPVNRGDYERDLAVVPCPVGRGGICGGVGRGAGNDVGASPRLRVGGGSPCLTCRMESSLAKTSFAAMIAVIAFGQPA